MEQRSQELQLGVGAPNCYVIYFRNTLTDKSIASRRPTERLVPIHTSDQIAS
jgi:hypothetical protein